MTARTYMQMIGADLTKLRRKRSIMAMAAFFTVGIVVIYFGISEIQHASDSVRYGPAGGVHNYNRIVEILGVFFGALSAILIGTEAGVADLASGTFRDLVVTGRSRLWLYAARIPAALIVTLAFALLAVGLSLAAGYGFAGGLPTPSASFAIDSVLWVCAAQTVLCVIAVGVGSLSGSRAASLTALIGGEVIAGRLLAQVSFFGSARDLIPNIALGALKRGDPLPDTNGLMMGAGLAVLVLVAWGLACLAAGAWRTAERDA
jgi:ABC-type transport system involved in multi-copper enzyme maturation permease subunit